MDAAASGTGGAGGGSAPAEELASPRGPEARGDENADLKSPSGDPNHHHHLHHPQPHEAQQAQQQQEQEGPPRENQDRAKEVEESGKSDSMATDDKHGNGNKDGAELAMTAEDEELLMMAVEAFDDVDLGDFGGVEGVMGGDDLLALDQMVEMKQKQRQQESWAEEAASLLARKGADFWRPKSPDALAVFEKFGVQLNGYADAEALTTLGQAIQGTSEEKLAWLVEWRAKASAFWHQVRFSDEDLRRFVQSYKQDERTRDLDLTFVPEVHSLVQMLEHYAKWERAHRTWLPRFHLSRTRTTPAAASSSSERVSFKTFTEIASTMQDQFPNLTSKFTEDVHELQKLVDGMESQCARLVDKMDEGTSRPSFRVLEANYQEMNQLCTELSSIPVEVPSGKKLELLSESLAWRRKACQTLVASSSRAAFLINPKAESAEYVPASDLDLEVLQELRDQAIRIGARSTGTEDECREEWLLMQRLEALLATTEKERDKVLAAIGEEHLKGLAGDATTRHETTTALRKLSDEVNSAAMSSDATATIGVRYPEREQLDQVVELCSWLERAVPCLERVRGPLEAFLQRHEVEEGVANKQTPPPPSAMQLTEEEEGALRNVEQVIAEVKSFGMESGANIEELYPDKVNAGRRFMSAVNVYDVLSTLARNVKTKRDAKVEKWRRDLVGKFVNVEWEKGDWYLAKVIAYKNLARVHCLLYDNSELETVLFKPNGEALSPDGEDSFQWTYEPKKTFQLDDKTMNRTWSKVRCINRAGFICEVADDTGDQIDTIDDRDFATSMVGTFIKVEGNPGDFWLGYVERFVAKTKLHYLLYENGQAEYARLREDGTAASRDGTETFSWVNTLEEFDLEPIEEVGSDDDLDYDDDSESSDAGHLSADDMIDDEDEDYAEEDTRKRKRKRAEGGDGAKRMRRADSTGSRRSGKNRSSKPSHKRARGKGAKGRQFLQQSSKAKVKVKVKAKVQPKAGAGQAAAIVKVDPTSTNELLKRKRDNALLLLKKVFGEAGTKMATKIEKRIFQMHEFFVRNPKTMGWERAEEGWHGYTHTVRRLITNFKSNPILLNAVLDGKIKAKKLVKMKAEELAGDAVQRRIQRQISELKESVIVNTSGLQQALQKKKDAEKLEQTAMSGNGAVGDPLANIKRKRAGAAAGRTGGHKFGERAVVLDEEGKPKALHPIDIKLAKAREAMEAGPSGDAPTSTGSTTEDAVAEPTKPMEFVPSLSSMVEVEVGDDAEADGEDEKGEGNEESDTKSKDAVSGGSPSSKSKVQCVDWKGSINKHRAKLRLLLNSETFGQTIKPAYRLNGSTVMGLLGKPGSDLKVKGRIKVADAQRYLETVATNDHSTRQFCVAEIKSEELDKFWLELEANNRVSFVDIKVTGVMLYLIPPRKVSMFRRLEHNRPRKGHGAAVLVVKPVSLRAIKYLSVHCKPLPGEKDPKLWKREGGSTTSKTTSSAPADPAAILSAASAAAAASSMPAVAAAPVPAAASVGPKPPTTAPPPVSSSARSLLSDPTRLQGLLQSIKKSTATIQPPPQQPVPPPSQGPLPPGPPPPSDARTRFLFETAEYCVQCGALDGRSAYNTLADRIVTYPFIQYGHPDHDLFLAYLEQIRSRGPAPPPGF